MRESPYLSGKDNYLDVMRRMAAFKDFNDEHLKSILSLSKIRVYDKGEHILDEGEYGCWMFFIIAGKVRVEKDGKKISTLGHPGDVFGEMGIIDGSSRSATVVSDQDGTMCLAVDASFLDRLSETDRTSCYLILYQLFSRILADRLRTAVNELAVAKDKMATMRKKIVDREQ